VAGPRASTGHHRSWSVCWAHIQDPKAPTAAEVPTASALRPVCASCGSQLHSSYGHIDVGHHTRNSLSISFSIAVDLLSGTGSTATHLSGKHHLGHNLCCTAGPERSGSTWLFNAVRLLLKHAHIPYDPYWVTTLTTDKLQKRKPRPQHDLLLECWLDCSLFESSCTFIAAVLLWNVAPACRQGYSWQSYNVQLTMMQCVPDTIIVVIIDNIIIIEHHHHWTCSIRAAHKQSQQSLLEQSDKLVPTVPDLV